MYIDGGAGGFFLPYSFLGLTSCADDVEALHTTPSNNFYFSLAPGSPSLAPGVVAGCPTGCGPADIFRLDAATVTVALFASASSLGLAANVNALAWGRALVSLPALPPSGQAALAIVMWLAAARSLSRPRRR
jgi:hypothetical protein